MIRSRFIKLGFPMKPAVLLAGSILAGVFLAGPDLLAATNAPLMHRLERTNAAPVLHSGPRTNAAPFVGLPGSRTNALAPGKATGTNAPSTLVGKFKDLPNNRAFYPVVIGIILCLAALLLFRSFKPKTSAANKSSALAPASKLTQKVGVKPGASIHACNVLEVGAEARQLWQFDSRGGRYALSRQQTCIDGEALPARLVGKDWRGLFQRKLNIAWLPPENVFLRVAQFPRSDFDETLAMVELQLEKLSPMPVAQVVWSLHILPHREGNLQTVIVSMVARNVVEEFLGRLEGHGYLADRLELPLLDQLQTTAITEDGAWIYPDSGSGKTSALVAWWYGGVLQNLDLLTLPPATPTRPAALQEQLMQMAWAGEMEGWLKSPPEWHLVADVGAAEWEPALRTSLEQPIELLTPLPSRELAALTARRSAQSEPRANLMPVEFAIRYQQQFMDRLWMRGLLAVGLIYLAIVAAYMVGLAYASWRTDGVESQVAQLSNTYTNAVQLKTRYGVLKDRQDLKYAALNCWDVVAKKLPENATLDNLTFSEGRRLNLRSTAPADMVQQLFNFERDLRQFMVDGELFFDPNPSRGETLQWRAQGATASWTVSLELKHSEAQ